MRSWTLTVIFLFTAPAVAQVQRVSDGIIIPVGDEWVKLQACGENVIRVACAKSPGFFDHPSLMVLPNHAAVNWTATNDTQSATLKTDRVQARIDLATGAVTFLNSDGQTLLAEVPGGRAITPADVQGEHTFHISQQWMPDADESLYGLGENQRGLVDIKGTDLDLWQHNGTMVIPLLLSTRGWGILWDNTSETKFGDTRPFEPIPTDNLPGGFQGIYYPTGNFQGNFTRQIDPQIDIGGPNPSTRPASRSPLPRNGPGSVIWTGDFVPGVTGNYKFETFSSGDLGIAFRSRWVVDYWRQSWLPWYDQFSEDLTAGEHYPIEIKWIRDQTPGTIQLKYKPPPDSPPNTSLWSEVGDGVDYYFVYGPELSKVVAGYRNLTGPAPMPPRWAFGLWQSRQRYETSQQSLDVLAQYRSRQIPIDNIVQDWLYWTEDSWGSDKFDPQRFPDPDGWIHAIHDQYHAQLMLSVWGKYYPGTANFRAMESGGFLFDSILKENLRDWRHHMYSFFDAFNPDADKLFWSQINTGLFSKGVDAWWMDATEPDLLPDPTLEGTKSHMNPTAMGTGSRVLNAYPLMISKTVYEGQRQAAPNQRVFILTRSAFGGQQRYAAANWSGDTGTDWRAMQRQIAAGLSFSISGIPYWTMDIGGFSVPARFSSHTPDPADLDEWRELFTRWFQFGTFCPLTRIHGEYPNRELWEFGGETSPGYQTLLKFDRLRYRMLPYIYSLAADVTRNGATIMRPLVMDFPDDKNSREITDEYLFGPPFLVSPITTYKARSRMLHLPSGADWYDFWTGEKSRGGESEVASAPYDIMPVSVRAGSIVPFGPDLQYAAEKPEDPITLFVYTGTDGAFDLYEDEGINYNYEHGDFAIIPLRWNEAAKTLTIGERQGSFPRMLNQRTFNIVFITDKKPVGFTFDPPTDKSVTYSGSVVDVQMP
ncbi:MAG: TIM-barrel domain-containing protein [Tepidisphaeraceae bacterium]|jgi:alpha-D-xyloside xylohydrolase